MPRQDQRASALFQPEPAQWGLRGDPFLWKAMEDSLRSTALPSTEAQCAALIEATFESLTGNPLTDAVAESESIHVKRIRRS